MAKTFIVALLCWCRRAVTTRSVRAGAGLLSMVVTASLLTSFPVAAQATDLAVLTPSAVAPGWSIDTGYGNAVALSAGVGAAFTPNPETTGMVRFLNTTTVSGFKSAQMTFAASSNMNGKTVGLWAHDAALTQIAAFEKRVVVANNTVSFDLPTVPVRMLYIFGLGTTPIVITNLVLSTNAPATTTTSASTTTLAGATTTAPTTTVASGDLSVLSPSAVAPGWSIDTGYGNNVVLMSGSGAVFTPNAETTGMVRFLNSSAMSGYKSVKMTFAPGSNMNGKTIGLWAYDAALAQIVGFDNRVAVSSNTVSIDLPTVPVRMLYVFGLGTAPITISNLVLSTTVSTPTTTIASGGVTTTVAGAAGDVAALTPSAWAPGWRIETDFVAIAAAPPTTDRSDLGRSHVQGTR
jgi:uncharacterized membrane-anchored protein